MAKLNLFSHERPDTNISLESNPISFDIYPKTDRRERDDLFSVPAAEGEV